MSNVADLTYSLKQCVGIIEMLILRVNGQLITRDQLKQALDVLALAKPLSELVEKPDGPTPLAVGDHIKDNDPRVRNRVLRVVSFTHDGFVMAETRQGNAVRIRADRIFVDEVPRKSGFSRVVLG
jgi:hypothetical protein